MSERFLTEIETETIECLKKKERFQKRLIRSIKLSYINTVSHFDGTPRRKIEEMIRASTLTLTVTG